MKKVLPAVFLIGTVAGIVCLPTITSPWVHALVVASIQMQAFALGWFSVDLYFELKDRKKG